MVLWWSKKESTSIVQSQAGLPAPISYNETRLRKSKLTLIAMRIPYTPPCLLHAIPFLWITASAYMASATLNNVLQVRTSKHSNIPPNSSLHVTETPWSCMSTSCYNSDWRRQDKVMGPISLSSPSTLEFSKSKKEAKNLTQSGINQT